MSKIQRCFSQFWGLRYSYQLLWHCGGGLSEDDVEESVKATVEAMEPDVNVASGERLAP